MEGGRGYRKRGEERKVEEVKGIQRWVIRESSYYKTAICLLAYHCMFNTAKPMRDVGNPQTRAAQEEITWVSCADQQTHTLFVTCFASFLMPSSYNLFMQLLLVVLESLVLLQAHVYQQHVTITIACIVATIFEGQLHKGMVLSRTIYLSYG